MTNRDVCEEPDVSRRDTLELAAAEAALGAALGMRPAGAVAQRKGDAKDPTKAQGPATGKESKDKNADGTVTPGGEAQQLTVKQQLANARKLDDAGQQGKDIVEMKNGTVKFFNKPSDT